MNIKQKGFTLIELLVVIAIIAILATIVISNLGGVRGKANDTKIVGQLSNMRTQANLYSGTGSAQSVAGCTVGTGTDCTTMTTTNLFFDTDTTAAPTYSLKKLISGLPTGTELYYVSQAGQPASGAMWAIAARTSTGTFCVDFTGGTRTTTTAIASGSLNTVYATPFGSYQCQ